MNFNKHFVQDLDNGMFYLKDKPGMEQMEHYTHIHTCWIAEQERSIT